MAEQLAISRTPVRGALKRLEYDHPVLSNSSKNMEVAYFTLQDAEDITEVRMALEPLACRTLAKKNY